jgi:predicted dinucleotide-binding enzyme
MRIAIIGAGNVGGTLGHLFAELDHSVTFGVRQGGTIKRGVPQSTTVALPADAARDAEVVILESS